MGEDVPDGDGVLAVARETRPALRDGLIEVEQAPFDKLEHGHGGEGLG